MQSMKSTAVAAVTLRAIVSQIGGFYDKNKQFAVFMGLDVPGLFWTAPDEAWG